MRYGNGGGGNLVLGDGFFEEGEGGGKSFVLMLEGVE